MQTNPLDASDFGQTLDQFGQHKTMFHVVAVVAQVLRDEYQFLDSAFCKIFGFGNNIIHLARNIFALEQRNCTESTVAHATFRNLEVGIMPPCTRHTRICLAFVRLFAKKSKQFVNIVVAAHKIDLGQFSFQIIVVASRQASENDYFLQLRCFLLPCQFQNRIYRLLLGIVYETAGIYKSNFGISAFCIKHNLVAVCYKLCSKFLRIDKILRAAHRHYIYFRHILIISG